MKRIKLLRQFVIAGMIPSVSGHAAAIFFHHFQW